MKFSASLLFLILTANTVIRTQALPDQVLMDVAARQVTAGEFMRMYSKSNDLAKSPGNVDEYLSQFIIFKLKVADAIQQGIDTTRAFRNELNGYRNQLAQNYLTDTQVKEQLLRKIYQRSLSEINAWHILVSCPEGSKPADTLNSWKKALSIRERLLKGESFEQVARGASDDPSARINGGNLGYFTVFQTIMAFEEAAYNLKKGEISEPVRTPYGYHIIKVTDIRPSRGKILVAHIMKAAPPGTGEKEARRAKESIDSIYTRLQAGESFSELAKRYSDHKESAANGGKLNWFGTGEIIPEFADAAFAIPDTGQYTKPVRTAYGWHIIKLLGRKSPGTFDETKSYLQSRINQSYLNSICKKSFIDRLKAEYDFRINMENLNWLVRNTDTLIIKGLSKYHVASLPSGYIYTFADQHCSVSDLISFIEKRSAVIKTNDPAYFINQTIDASSTDRLMKYENSMLEKKYPDFRYLMNEFHDGILLFEISGRKIWNNVQKDSAGLRQYYDAHKIEFLSKRTAEAKLYMLRSVKDDKMLYSAYKKYSGRENTDQLLLERFNRKNDSLLVIRDMKWFQGDDKEIDDLEWTKGPKFTRRDGFPAVVVIKDILEPVPLPLSAVQSEVMTGYQDYLEKEWVKQLKEKYTVKIDTLVYDRVKNSFRNE